MKPTSLLLSLSLLIFISCNKNKDDELSSNQTPVINAFSNTASIGDTLTVAGEKFPMTAGSLEVYFGDQKANIISQNDKAVRFIVPLLKSTSCNLILKDSKGNVLKQQEFQLEAVKITSTLAKVKSGETLTIYGKNFQLLQNIKVSVNDKEVSGLNVNASGLSFTMPETIYPGRKPNINVTANTSSSATNLSTTTTVSDKWVRVAYSPFVFRALFAAFVYKDEGYVLSHDKEGTDKKALFYKLNPATYKYTTYEVSINTTDAVATTEHIYYVTDYTKINKFDIDPSGRQFITQVPDLTERNNRFVGIGKNIYALTSKAIPNFRPTNMTFYKYDVVSNSWSLMAPFPEQNSALPKLTVDGNKLYVLMDYTRFYVYDAETNKWERKSFSINPDVKYVTAFYAQHGKVYALITPGMSSETIYEYDPVADKWTSRGKLREEISGNFYGFFIGNKHFIGGNKYDSWSTELFESDASYLLQ